MEGVRVEFRKPAVVLLFFVAFVCACSSQLSAETELWFGTYTDENGKIRQGRYIINRAGRIIGVQLASYGLLPVDFVVIEHDAAKGFLRMAWPGNPQKTCTLFRYDPDYYAGNWIDGTRVQPMVMKKFDERDGERQGKFFFAKRD